MHLMDFMSKIRVDKAKEICGKYKLWIEVFITLLICDLLEIIMFIIYFFLI